MFFLDAFLILLIAFRLFCGLRSPPYILDCFKNLIHVLLPYVKVVLRQRSALLFKLGRRRLPFQRSIKPDTKDFVTVTSM